MLLIKFWVRDKTNIFRDIIKKVLLSEATNYQTAIDIIKELNHPCDHMFCDCRFISGSQFLCRRDAAVTNFQIFTRCLYIVSLHKQIPSCIPTRKHPKASNLFTSEVTEMSRQSMKAFRILSKISFKDREKQPFSNTVTQISICRRQSFTSLPIKLCCRKEGSSNCLWFV
jgi:hypothetical protein